MRAVESQWWIIELPDEWEAEQDDETILISDEDGVGEIAITTLQKENGPVDDSELRLYTEDIESQFGRGQVVELFGLNGSLFVSDFCSDIQSICEAIICIEFYSTIIGFQKSAYKFTSVNTNSKTVFVFDN